MAYINQTQDPRRRATAIAGVVAVHAVLALGLLSMGLWISQGKSGPAWDPFVLTLDPKPKPPPPNPNRCPRRRTPFVTVPTTPFDELEAHQ